MLGESTAATGTTINLFSIPKYVTKFCQRENPVPSIRFFASRVFGAVCLLISLSGYLYAQSSDATVTGIVRDTAKAVIIGAKIDLINVDTGVHHPAATNGLGIYSVAAQVGNYRMELEHPGFKTVITPGIVLHTQDVQQINFEMAVGSTAESVTVSASSADLNTTDASVSTVIDRQFAENLPLNGRSFQSLIYLTPGVTLNVGSGPSGFAASGQFTVNESIPGSP
jgi:Carboxypeptidase regulatory-like domain